MYELFILQCMSRKYYFQEEQNKKRWESEIRYQFGDVFGAGK